MSGTLTGNSGSVTLDLNGTSETFNASGFTFSSTVQDNSSYTVSFVSASGGQTCTVDNGSGTSTSNISNVSVSCTTPPPTTTTSYRTSHITKDFDNNGNPELSATVNYSSDARDVNINFIYADDGTPDEFILGSDSIRQSSAHYTFSASGLPNSLSIENTYEDTSTEIITFTYAYNSAEDKIDSITIDRVTSTGTNITTTWLTGYTNNQLTSFTFDMGTVTGGWEFIYNGDGSLSTTLYRVNGNPVEEANYTWRSDGQIDTIVKEEISSGKFYRLNTTYSAGGQIINADHIDEISPTYEDTNYTENFDFDSQGKLTDIHYDPLTISSIKATESTTWEQESCFEFYTPSPAAISWPNMATGYNALFPAGIFVRAWGCEP